MAEASSFDYSNFIDELINQVENVTPDDLNVFEKKYVKNAIKEFSTIAAKYMTEDTNYSQKTTSELTQIIAEWTFHKCIDLMRSTIPQVYWDTILQKINFTIFELYKACIENNINGKERLKLIESSVDKCYQKAVQELKEKNFIDDETFATAIIQSNIDKMSYELAQEPSLKEKITDVLSKMFSILTMFAAISIAIIPKHLSIWEVYSCISLIALGVYALFRTELVVKPFYLLTMFFSATCLFINQQFMPNINIALLTDVLIIGLAGGALLGYKIGQKNTEL